MAGSLCESTSGKASPNPRKLPGQFLPKIHLTTRFWDIHFPRVRAWGWSRDAGAKKNHAIQE